MTKEKLKKTIVSLPDDFLIEDVIKELIVVDKIEKGLKDVKDGKEFTTEEAKDKLNKWLK